MCPYCCRPLSRISEGAVDDEHHRIFPDYLMKESLKLMFGPEIVHVVMSSGKNMLYCLAPVIVRHFC